MYAYPVRPTILPEHLRLGSITALTLLALLICLRGLWRGATVGPGSWPRCSGRRSCSSTGGTDIPAIRSCRRTPSFERGSPGRTS